MAEAQNIRQPTQTQAELARRLEGLTMATNIIERSQVTLPCHFLPFGHNPNFYGRTTILQSIQDALAVRNDDLRIRSVALWGTGGIGKSQIALELHLDRTLQSSLLFYGCLAKKRPRLQARSTRLLKS